MPAISDKPNYTKGLGKAKKEHIICCEAVRYL